MPSHDTTSRMIQLVSKLKMIQETYYPSSSDNIRGFPLPTELRVSTCLSGSLSNRFPLHKGFSSLICTPSAKSPYQCQFLSSKYQVVDLFFFIMDLGLLCFRVIIKILDNIPIFFKENSPISYSLKYALKNNNVLWVLYVFELIDHIFSGYSLL
jgi:hypothetical protein